MQDRPMAFNMIEYEKFIDIVSDSILKLTFSLNVVSKKITHRHEKKLLNMSLFSNYICDVWLSSWNLSKTKYFNQSNAEAGIRIQLSFTKSDVKRFLKCKSRASLFVLEK